MRMRRSINISALLLYAFAFLIIVGISLAWIHWPFIWQIIVYYFTRKSI